MGYNPHPMVPPEAPPGDETVATRRQGGIPIIRTKLHRPPVNDRLVGRGRLHERLDLGLQMPLTVVSAPAGYGKSMLVSHWVESLDRPCAWLSLDTAENGVTDFVEYVLAAIQTSFPDACAQTEAMVMSPNPAPIPILGASLLNDLDAIDEEFVLVLDDYHRIESSSAVHDLMSFVLDHPPRSLCIVMATRRDPPVAMSSLRGKNLVNEIRLEDLRFTKAETAELLATVVDLPVGAGSIANLDRQIEGWAAGLQLVCLALRHAKDPVAFLESLHGGLPHTQEYLIHEVLAGQQPPVRECLLKISILDRFCPQVFEAVCSPESTSEQMCFSGREFVDMLQNCNLFTISLDIQGVWFRFHHLFQEILHKQLEQERETSEIAAVHLRASQWFESEGLITESITHALAAGEPDRAADIVERHRHSAFNADRWFVVERWLAMLPQQTRLQRPALILADGWIAYTRLELARFPEIINRCEEAAGAQKLEASLTGELQFFRGSLAYWMGDAEKSRQLLEEALLQNVGRRYCVEGETELALALARGMVGDADAAIRSLEDRILEAASSDVIYVTKMRGGLLLLHLLSGDLNRAIAEVRRFRKLATKNHLQNVEAWGDYFEGLLHLAAHDVDAASRHFARAADRRYVLDTRASFDAFSGLALAQQLMQQPEAARESVRRLQKFADELQQPEYAVVADSCAARIALLQGDFPAAEHWAKSFSEEPDLGSFFMWLEAPSITRARVLIAAGSDENLQEAADALGVFRQHCEGWRFECQVIEIAVLQALVLEKQGRSDDAERALSEAVALARPGDWVRPFVEAGPVMAGMLDRMDATGGNGDFVCRIQAAIAPDGQGISAVTKSVPPAEPSAAQRKETPTRTGQPELDALTDRELDILELLHERLYNKEIAAKLCISIHTVNYHLKNVYSKLGVTSRRQAVNHAIEMGILKTPG